MRNKILHLCLVSVIALSSANAQDRKITKANKSFADYNYYKAIDQYEALVENGNTSPETYQNLGDANYFNASYREAAKWYGMLADLGPDAIDKEHMYRYAVSLRTIEKYDESDQWIAKLNAAKQGDQRGRNFSSNRDYLKKIAERSGGYTIDSLSINSSESDFSPSFHKGNIVFSTARDTSIGSKNVHNWNKKEFLNLYTATPSSSGDFMDIGPFSGKLNTKLHESSTAFTKDGNTVYFTRNNGIDGRFRRDDDGVSRLQIYRATLKNGKWENLESMPFNADNYSVAHPTLNKAEDKLYFSSDMPGTMGQSDIWVAEIRKNGSLGTPVNLGPKINSESKETFPFITEDDILYFASDGHPGLGGMDIFATDVKNLENSDIVNLGEPINSIYDDFSLIIDNDTKQGYFASNRVNGRGSDDIYSFLELRPLDFECLKDIAGIVKDKKTGAILSNANVIVYDSKNEKISETISNTDGTFALEGRCNEGNYMVVGEKESYEKGAANFENKNGSPVERIELLLSQVEQAPTGTNLAKYLKLEPIYFDFGRSFIRADARIILEKVLAYMRKYPSAKVDVRSHTDSRANNAYNIALSDRRAKSTITYLIKQGIDKSRITGRGYGETQLTNECDDNTSCSKEKHQRNRRSEFVVVG
ncbi:OmpA family protein [Maribacter sp. 2308TA10-17]|uniref:OmpA family protein n=1 Tax=Maribacter sp. 2308TA10-17 TaxID=3386276 RepID=UPI0039BCD3AD